MPLYLNRRGKVVKKKLNNHNWDKKRNKATNTKRKVKRYTPLISTTK